MRIPFDVPLSVGHELIVLEPDVIAAVLVTLEAGWAHASTSPNVHAGAGEVAITEHLRDGMRHLLKTNVCPWGKTMMIAPGTESRSRPEVLLPDGLTDIPIYLIEVFFRLGEHDPHAIIECKRIAGTNAHLCREYVVEGIDRFRLGKYGRRHAAGLMAGYLVASDACAAATGVNAYLGRQQRESEHLGRSQVLTEAWAWRSRHQRDATNEPIELHHAFLDFRRAQH